MRPSSSSAFGTPARVPDCARRIPVAHDFRVRSLRASGRTYGQAMNELVHYALERSKIQPKRYIGPTDTLLTEYLARRAANK